MTEVTKISARTPRLYMIAGCNGAGKTTASFTILPEILQCREFVNADNIAAGLSPFNPENVAFEAGRIMLKRVDELLVVGADFALETTLSTRSYVSTINKAKSLGYSVTLIYFWLASPAMAIERVAKRVRNGGHSIPEVTIIRRYKRGLNNLFKLYLPICDNWLVVSNMSSTPSTIAIGRNGHEKKVINDDIWDQIKQSCK